MYKRKSKPLAPLSSQNRSTLANTVVASTSSLALPSQSPQTVPSRLENIDPVVSPAKRTKPSQQVNNAQDEDMFDIPCSQNPTAPRFSSQRSIMARTQSILAIHRQPKNYFESVLMKCGVGLESECYVLTCNHLNFVTKVRELLRSNDTYPDNITEFIAGVTDAMKTFMTLAKLFSACKLSLPSSDSIYQSQESLIKDLLVIDFLQVYLIQILFEKIETFVGNDETLNLENPYVELILSELKFLNIVEHGDIVSLKIFQVFELATANYRQVIIKSIPDIIDVTRHDDAMERLMRLVPDDENLLAFSNVDTYGNMHLNADNLSKLRNKIVNHMKYRPSYESFPSFVKFILRIDKDEMDALPQSNYVKICIGLCLRLFSAVFTWPSFQLEAHKPLLKESLSRLAESSQSEVDGQQAIDNIVDRHACTMWDLQSAVHMLHLIRSLAVHSTSIKSNDKIVDLCRQFLSKKWYSYDGTPERGGKCNVLLDDLLKGLMKGASLSKIDEILNITAREAKGLNGKNDCMKSFPIFYKANVALLYRSLSTALIHAVEDRLSKSAPTAVQLKIFEKSTVLLWTMADSVTVTNIPRNYGIFLKYAHIYIKIFLKNGIPLIKTGLRSNSDRIIYFLKNFNKMAAFIHKICCHWKANQNAAIMAQIPFIRETIETLLIKVKDVLAANNCACAFWKSNLKNKNLMDEEILTQSTDPEDENDDDDDELPEDDDSVTYEEEGYSRETSVETTRRITRTNSDASSLLC